MQLNPQSQIQKSQIKMVDRKGFEPLLEVCKTSMLPVNITNPKIKMVQAARVELAITRF
jgi:hypothetical protein